MIPYSTSSISEQDIDRVVEVLRSDYLTTGLNVEAFEKKFAKKIGAKYAVAMSNGTAALHAVMIIMSVQQSSEVIVPTITFVATANCVKYAGARVVVSDVDPDTLLIDVNKVKKKIINKTAAIITVDYAGQSAISDELVGLCHDSKIKLISDSCHSMHYDKRNFASCYSFHPVKNMTTGEGGMVATESEEVAEQLKSFRNHGRVNNQMYYLGFNYRLSDMQCALGISQLKRVDTFINIKRRIADKYDKAFSNLDGIVPLKRMSDTPHSHHLYVLKVDRFRDEFRKYLEAKGIGTQIHYNPVHLEPFYSLKDCGGPCPVAEKVAKQIVSIPLYSDLKISEQDYIIEVIKDYRG